jgi:hypothetical protein
VDISYEDLADFAGQEKQFGWSQALRGVAQSFERWAEKNASHAECETSLAFAGRLRLASLKARPDGASADPKAEYARSELWEKLKKTDDVSRLIRFADSFPNSVESFSARDLVAAWEAFKKEFIRYSPSMHHSLADVAASIPKLSSMVDEALQRDQESVFSSMNGKKALELRAGHLNEVLGNLTKSIVSNYRVLDWPGFVDRWPNHPYADGMLEYISQREQVMSLIAPLQERLRGRMAGIDELLALHEEAEAEAEDSEREDGDEATEVSDPWDDRGLRNEPGDEVEFLENLPEIEGISKWKQMQAAQRALLDFCDAKAQREREAELAALTEAQDEEARLDEMPSSTRPPRYALPPNDTRVAAGARERWYHVAGVIAALLFMALPR